MTVLQIENVKKYFFKEGLFWKKSATPVKALDGVSFSVAGGTTFGLVGESGSGKSTLAKIILNILRPDSGFVKFSGAIDMVFQDPYSSLNPRMKVQDIISEALYIEGADGETIQKRLEEVLGMVRLDPLFCRDKYPHQFSGGERQRIAIARALIRKPDILVLDEPVSSLDVSIQAEILNLLKDLQEEMSLTYLFISHDLRIVEFMSDRVGVMNNGNIVEIADKKDIYTSPRDEYTKSLLNAIPKI